MRIPVPFTLIIFGGTGDLSRRKLFPALLALQQGGHLPERFQILALGRKDYDNESFRTSIMDGAPGITEAGWVKLLPRIQYLHMDVSKYEDFLKLKVKLTSGEEKDPKSSNHLYYLATPPDLYTHIAQTLASVDLTRETGGNWRRIVFEKPFGSGLESAKLLNQELTNVLNEDQIYRIDHYLGKESVQNIFALRFGNGIFEPTWNREFIHHIEITAAESIGVELRGAYYEESGALRDMIQNHLLQLLAIVAMEPPKAFLADDIRDMKEKVFNALRPIQGESVSDNVIRGQYIDSTIRGISVPGYRQETGVAKNSTTETFVAMRAYIDHPRWQGVPFYIRTGKRLPTRVTEVVIHYKAPVHNFFPDKLTADTGENQLVIRIQPDEGILLKLGMKVPGAGFKLKTIGMDFHYSDVESTSLPDAYERLILDALLGDSTLYARTDGVEAAWAFIDPILKAWQSNKRIKLYGYPAGSWGPNESIDLFEDEDEDWRYPCKNLTGEDTFCEL